MNQKKRNMTSSLGRKCTLFDKIIIKGCPDLCVYSDIRITLAFMLFADVYPVHGINFYFSLERATSIQIPVTIIIYAAMMKIH